MTAIGFAGLGAMGCQIAGRLLDGSQPYGSNRTPAKAAGLIERGMTWRNTPREIAEAAEVVFSMVTDDAARTDLTPDGAAGRARSALAVSATGGNAR